ncbi:MAG: thioredoxin [Candidatus Nezhaarchaeota archaeon]|nr:thioredoxin [Candidatus Nezhaarchaeota archaeon]MCX8141850.1 thioredoxin [Candidatus Nezhaarchaeota archaeon]MDW8050369.1 thioredoxin [Nitrososphaerota archaeon]
MTEEFDQELELLKEKKAKELMTLFSRKTPLSNVLHLDSEHFKELLKVEKRPIIVDFWAEWCAPCRMLSPIIDKLAEKYSGKVVFVKVNVDENPEIAEQYGIMAIPTLILFINGIEADRIVGLVPERQIEALIRKHLK